ncbi:Splicing factor 3B subunit 3 [Branchiostoma belcheri]|nr:Splicing factor 3B subunit 3 [Branchiostoma belcheri]
MSVVKGESVLKLRHSNSKDWSSHARSFVRTTGCSVALSCEADSAAPRHRLHYRRVRPCVSAGLHATLQRSALSARLYCPKHNVIDGDLCEQFNSMEPSKQKSVAEELDRTPAEVSKKLEDIRTRYAF